MRPLTSGQTDTSTLYYVEDAQSGEYGPGDNGQFHLLALTMLGPQLYLFHITLGPELLGVSQERRD